MLSSHPGRQVVALKTVIFQNEPTEAYKLSCRTAPVTRLNNKVDQQTDWLHMQPNVSAHQHKQNEPNTIYEHSPEVVSQVFSTNPIPSRDHRERMFTIRRRLNADPVAALKLDPALPLDHGTLA